MAELLRTPLAERHRALGARMAPFGGWLMPIQYEGIVAEHLHTRAAAGLFDLSHMGRLAVTGPEAAALLQRATTNDVERLADGAAQYSLLCNAQGGILEDLLVYRLPELWRLVVNAANRRRVIDQLDRLRDELELKATVRDDTFDQALLGLQGPESEAILGLLGVSAPGSLAYYHARQDAIVLADRALASGGATGMLASAGAALPPIPALLSRTGYTGEDGFELMVAAADVGVVWDRLLADPRVRPVGLGARDTLRLEAGMALYEHELTEEVSPFEAGLSRVVRFEKGDFTGRDALGQLRGVAPARTLVGLGFEVGAVPRAGHRVLLDGDQVGQIASGTFSPTLRRPIATAYVRSAFAEPGAKLQVDARGVLVPARVVSLPFVPHQTRRGRAAAG
ncbi:MAG: glycine cleavage system aminomethyltransferase GcvT [Chloroflexi bacterium]|nr:glycine cleavage system aminomethyltransferase GcvT [Chloroflexota bacterium]